MCANFAQNFTNDHLVAAFSLVRPDIVMAHQMGPREVYPQRAGWVIHRDGRLTYRLWGMLPRGATDNSVGIKYATFNAKSETVDQSRLYKPAWKDGNRCVIPVSTFTEWRGVKGSKEKLFVRAKDQEITMLAGLYDSTDPNDEGFKTFTMLTTEPNEFTKVFHHRMPVILSDWREWLNPDLGPEDAKSLLVPYTGEMEFLERTR